MLAQVCPPKTQCTYPSVLQVLSDKTIVNMTATIPFNADRVKCYAISIFTMLFVISIQIVIFQVAVTAQNGANVISNVLGEMPCNTSAFACVVTTIGKFSFISRI